MIVGSVRGKVRFDKVVRVEQAGLSLGVSAASVGGQTRFAPPFRDNVRCPHVPQ